MSEFTDFHAMLTDAQSLSALRGSLERAVGGAYVPLDELPDGDALMDLSTAEAAWAALEKPVWIKLGIAGTLDQLASLGPAVHIKVEEDFTAWALDVRCGQVSHSFAILDTPDRYREATDGIALFDPGSDLGPLANCLGVTADALSATMTLDGGESFSTLLGIQYEQMLDMTLEDIEVGDVGFGYLFLTFDG